MAKLFINLKNILKNIKEIDSYLFKYEKKWSLIVKLLSGHEETLRKILNDELITNLHSIGDSRLGNLKIIKKIKPNIQTMYIKPPAVINKKSVIKYADISFNSSYETINILNEEAKKQNKIHKVVIMVEMGELREGILREKISSFYSSIFNLSNINVIGIGTNLGCMYGIEPTYDKLIQLSLYKTLIEERFKQKLEIISGGSSITLPLIEKEKIPKEINHFRIGEAVFFGTSPLYKKRFKNLSTNTFEFTGNIIELEKKETIPDGNITDANIGITSNENYNEKKAFRAILDFGLLDVDIKELTPKDKDVKFAGTTSDMTVFDIGGNKNKNNKQKYKVGDKIYFKLNYMAVAKLIRSKDIKKKIEF